MTVRSRRSLILPNAIRRAMAYPRGAGRHAITGYPAAAGIPPGGGVPLVFDALTYDPITYEMLGVKTGIGGLTIARGSERYVLNSDGLYSSVAAYAAAWSGGRYVQNLLRYSEDLSNAVWSTSTAAILGTLVTFSASYQAVKYTGSRAFGTGTLLLTLDIEHVSGGTNMAVSLNNDGWAIYAFTVEPFVRKKYVISLDSTNSASSAIHVIDQRAYSSFTINLYSVQLENVTGRADPDTPSEYCPTDTLADGDPSGYKVFANENGNSVTDNVVTEGVGAPLPEVPWLSDDPAATNSQVWSNDITQAAWMATNSASTFDQIGLNGQPNFASLLKDDSSTGTGGVNAYDDLTVVSGQNNCLVAYVKAAGLSWCRLSSPNYDANMACYFDLANGVVGADTSDASEIIDLGGGLYKCIMQFSTVTDLVGHIMIHVANGSGDTTVDLDGTSSIYVGNMEVHKNKTIAEVRGLPPIFTEGTAVSVQADVPTLDIANHSNTRGAYYFEWKPSYAGTGVSLGLINTRNAAEGILYDGTGDRINTFDGTNYGWSGTPWPINQTNKVALVYDADEGLMQVNLNGEWGSVQTYDGAFNTGAGVINLFFGNEFSNVMRNLQRYDLPYAEAQAKIDELMN